MTILDLPPLGESKPRIPLPSMAPGSDYPAPSGPSAGAGLLQFQLRRVIGEILADPGLDPDMYVSLATRLAENPDHPGQALLAHLRDVQGPDDLPPFRPHGVLIRAREGRACRQPLSRSEQ